MRTPLLLVALALIGIFATPAQAQDQGNVPGLAPAIGPWLGAPRGSFGEIAPGDDQLVLSGTARDPDSAQRVSYEVLIDGEVAVTGLTAAPGDFGEEMAFSETIDTEPGLHEVCLRLDDPVLGMRTVDCRDAITSPPSRVSNAVANSADGVAISQTGVVLPITGGRPGNLAVTTPCGATTRIDEASIVERARIVIDPGHGGSESGSVGAGLLEKNVNLAVSNVVIQKFEDLGISAQLTRTSDYRVPIATRANIAAALGPDVFLSLHHNGGAVRPSSDPGTEIFYAEGRPESERLARILYESMQGAASQFDARWVDTVNQGASVRLRDDGMDLFGIHRFSPGIESVITEFLYLSNPSEAVLMTRPEVIEAEAQSIVDGIIRWWFDSGDDPETPGLRFTDPSSSGTGGFDNCVDPALNLTNAALNAPEINALTGQPVEPVVAPPRSLLPALVLGADPAIG